MRNMLLRDIYSCPVFSSLSFYFLLLICLFSFLFFYFIFFFTFFSQFLYLCVGLVVRADINECELVPVPCAYQCVNSPGSYKCLCPPGLHLLGDGKSCAGLERLPNYESFSYGYRTSQSSSDRSSYQQRYHSLTSQSYHSYVPIGGRHVANRPNNAPSRSRRDTNTCPPGFKAKNGQCLGNYKSWSVVEFGFHVKCYMYVYVWYGTLYCILDL